MPRRPESRPHGHARPLTGWAVLGLAALSLAAGLGACRLLDADGDYEERVSHVHTVALPDTVAAGGGIPVRITTWGANGCWRQGRDDVRAVDGGYRITPYDRAYVGRGTCTMALVDFVHEVELPAPAPGRVRVDVRHRLRAADGTDSLAVRSAWVAVR